MSLAAPNFSCSGRADSAKLVFLRQLRRATEHQRWAEVAMRYRRHFVLMLLILLPVVAQAKHVAPPAVPAITNNGVRYVVPNDRGLRAYVEAWSVSTGQRLWTKTIFTHWYIPPFGTECMHYEWIKSMVLVKDDLLLTSERGRAYKLIIHTRSVQRAKKAPNLPVQATAAAHFGFSGWEDSQAPGFAVAQPPAAVPDVFRWADPP